MIAQGDDLVPGLEKITGETVDITEYLDFAFWDLVWYSSNLKDGPCLGRWLGVSHRVGSALCYHFLKSNGEIESRTTVQHVTQDDLDKPETKACIDEFNKAITERLKDDNSKLKEGEAIIYDDIDDDVSDSDKLGHIEPNVQNMNHAVERNDYDDDEFDALLLAELLLPNESADGFIQGTVIKRAKNNSGQPIGTRHADANLDTRRYIFKISNDMERELQHNLIATNMFTQADLEGWQFLLLDEILDYRKLDLAVKKKDATHVGHNGNPHKLRTTKVYEFLVLWKDGSTDWIPLKDMYASNPLETVEFTVACQLQDEPVFAWLVRSSLNIRNKNSNVVSYYPRILNDVEVSTCDISGAYLNAPIGEKV